MVLVKGEAMLLYLILLCAHCRLLVQEAASLEELNSMIIDLSGEELWQVRCFLSLAIFCLC